MIKSMTAYARVEQENESGRFLLEIRSLNHRYLDVQLGFPDWLKPWEMEIRKRIGKQVKRGKVEVNIFYQPPREKALNIELDTDRLDAINRAFDVIKLHLPHAQSPNALELLNFPEVLANTGLDVEPLLPLLWALLDQLMDELIKSREKEGESLQAFVQQKCRLLLEHVAHIEQLRPQVLQRQKDRLLQLFEQISRASEGVALEQGRMEQELVYFANKLDIAEEIARIRAHIDHIDSILQESKPIGRKLDFLMQELNREANTLGAKSQDIATTNDAVELKVLIEQMREQVQNIE